MVLRNITTGVQCASIEMLDKLWFKNTYKWSYFIFNVFFVETGQSDYILQEKSGINFQCLPEFLNFPAYSKKVRRLRKAFTTEVHHTT